jgi:hypothetical protein
LQLQVRNQITNLPVATPQAGNDGPAQSAIEVAVEPPRPIQQELPKNFARPGALTSAPEAPSARPPKPDESVAVAMPSLIAPMPQLEIALPRMKQAEAQATGAAAGESVEDGIGVESACAAAAGQRGYGRWRQPGAVAVGGDSAGRARGRRRRKFWIFIRENRCDFEPGPQVTIPTLPVAPAIGGEVETVSPATAESTHVAGPREESRGRFRWGAESSANPIASLDQPASLKRSRRQSSEQPAWPMRCRFRRWRTVKLPQPAASPFGSR